MRPDIKFCGLTRAEDAAHAASLGARYVGVIFAGGPRSLDAQRAATVLDGAGSRVKRVGVFAAATPDRIADTAREARLDVIQLHGDPEAATVIAMRAATACSVWAVIRVADGTLPPGFDELAAVSDAVLLDSKVAGRLGGSGVPFAWTDVAAELAGATTDPMVVLAGGLTPDNVRAGIAALNPDVVDVSSGVESAPGIKDHDRMRDFADAVWRQ